MPKAMALKFDGVSFEDGLRRMLGTPPPKSPKPVQKPAKKRKKR